jgi:hypothetical protein
VLIDVSAESESLFKLKEDTKQKETMLRMLEKSFSRLLKINDLEIALLDSTEAACL